MADKVQEFIEKYYPNYSSANEIAWESDTYKLVMKEYEESEDDIAYELLMNDYGGDINNPKIKSDWMKQYIDILQMAIVGYMSNKQVENG